EAVCAAALRVVRALPGRDGRRVRQAGSAVDAIHDFRAGDPGFQGHGGTTRMSQRWRPWCDDEESGLVYDDGRWVRYFILDDGIGRPMTDYLKRKSRRARSRPRTQTRPEHGSLSVRPKT